MIEHPCDPLRAAASRDAMAALIEDEDRLNEEWEQRDTLPLFFPEEC